MLRPPPLVVITYGQVVAVEQLQTQAERAGHRLRAPGVARRDHRGRTRLPVKFEALDRRLQRIDACKRLVELSIPTHCVCAAARACPTRSVGMHVGEAVQLEVGEPATAKRLDRTRLGG